MPGTVAHAEDHVQLVGLAEFLLLSRLVFFGLDILDDHHDGRVLVFHQGRLGDGQPLLLGLGQHLDMHNGLARSPRSGLGKRTLTAKLPVSGWACTAMNATLPSAACVAAIWAV